MNLQQERREWFGNLKGDVLAGLVSSFAVIPEVVGFCIVAGISPMMGLYASFWLTVLMAFLGGRPAMISAAAGSMALVIVSLVRDHGPEYLMAATILCGVIMFILGVLGIGNLLKLIPNSVQIGFVDALAILIFSSQLGNFEGESWSMYALVALGIVIIYLFPRLTTAVPSTLVAVIVVTAIAILGDVHVRTIGDMGTITAALPPFHIPSVPLNLDTLLIILPYSLSLAIVGLSETLLTSKVIDEMTDTQGDRNRECRGLGIANIVSGFFSGTCGCAMIGQAIVNVNSGGRGRLSNFVSGSFLMVLIFLLNDLMVQIPLAALVAVMITVSISTFDWGALGRLNKMPRTDAAVIIIVVAIVVATNNLAYGVIVGLALTAIFFALHMAKVSVSAKRTENETHYYIQGPVFFASTEAIVSAFEYRDNGKDIFLDFSKAHLWDESGASALRKAVSQFERNGCQVCVTGLDESSEQLLTKLYGGEILIAAVQTQNGDVQAASAG
ncbi:MAG: SulP family inorganic anion transporter [Peptococcaceae bacterium]|nr:SulP family inorganic anion transporter [Peptococcaceae bacterium]